MYPDVYREFREARQKYGDLTNLPTPNFFGVAKIGEEVTLLVEHGKELAATLVNVGVISPNGTREVMFKLNGEFRAVSVVDDKGQTSFLL
jgi:pyruvate carboxylase